MSETFSPHFISEHDATYQEYKERARDSVSSRANSAFGENDLQWLNDLKQIAERPAVDKVDNALEQTNVLARIRRNMEKLTEDAGRISSAAYLFQESLELPATRTVVDAYKNLDAIYEIPDEFKVMIALRGGRITPPIADAIADSIFLRATDEYNKTLGEAMKSQVSDGELLALIHAGQDAALARVDAFTRALPKLTEVSISIASEPIADSLLVSMLEHHATEYHKKREAFEAATANFKARFSDAIAEAHSAGWLPINLEIAQQRIAETSIHFRDVTYRRAATVRGVHHAGNFDVTISSNTPENEYEKILFHEFTHVLSGKTIIHAQDSQYIQLNVQFRRDGLSFPITPKGTSGPTTDSDMRFDWLNEAITEEVAMRLENRMYSGLYADERLMLGRLYRAGVSQAQTYKAYFEDYTPNDREQPSPTHNPIPEWKKFNAEIRTVANWKSFIAYDNAKNAEYRKRENPQA